MISSTLTRMRNVRDKTSIKNQNAHLTVNKVSPKFAPFRDNVKKNIAGSDRSRMTIWRISFTFQMTKAKYRHTLRLFNTNCFSTATMVT